MKVLPLLSQIYILTYTVCFDVTKFPSATSIYLSVSTNEPGIKSEISGVMWQVAPESKIQLVSCELSQKSLLGMSILENIYAIDAYILCDSFLSVLLSNVLSIFVDMYERVLGFYVFQWTLFSELSGFLQFVMKWSSAPHLKYVFGFQPLRSVRLLLDLCELKDGFLLNFSFLCCLKNFQLGVILHSDCTFNEKFFLSLHILLNFQDSSNQFARQI